MLIYKAALGALLCSVLGAVHAQAPETVWVPMPDGAASIQLEATLFKPVGSGPFPLVVFKHGSSGGPIPASYTEKARDLGGFLAARGVALLVPMRRGRGKSDGANQVEPSACTPESARAGITYASHSLDAAFAYLNQQPWPDMSKVVLAGHSRGGILASSYAGSHPGVVKGVINFNGGWKNDNCGPLDINIALFEQAGKQSTEPNLFLDGRSDFFYTDASIEHYASSYAKAGGKVSFKFYQLKDLTGHMLFHRALPAWEKDVAAFLTEVGL